MAEFFRQAPAPESLQKRLFESIFHKQSVVGSFPLATPILPLYSFPAMMLSGLAIALCLDDVTVRRNVAALRHAGYEAPTVFGLEGDTPPHAQRAVFDAINHHRVQLLFITPEQFCAFSFLPVLAHARVSFLAIEDAQCLLPGYCASHRYERALDTLAALRQRPTLALFTLPLSPARRNALLRRIAPSRDPLAPAQTFLALEHPPDLTKTVLRVRLALTERDKFNALCHTLAGTLEKGRIGALLNVGSVLIRTRDSHSAEILLQRLHRVGFEPLSLYHDHLPAETRDALITAFTRQRHAILVSSGPTDRLLISPPGEPCKVVYWQLPMYLEETFGQLFQAQPEEARTTEGVFLYTRDDYHEALARAQAFQATSSATSAAKLARVQAVRRCRQWQIQDKCRIRGLTALVWPDLAATQTADCGVCDVCASPARGGFLRRTLRHWLY